MAPPQLPPYLYPCQQYHIFPCKPEFTLWLVSMVTCLFGSHMPVHISHIYWIFDIPTSTAYRRFFSRCLDCTMTKLSKLNYPLPTWGLCFLSQYCRHHSLIPTWLLSDTLTHSSLLWTGVIKSFLAVWFDTHLTFQFGTHITIPNSLWSDLHHFLNRFKFLFPNIHLHL